jgi:hypothetical protein
MDFQSKSALRRLQPDLDRAAGCCASWKRPPTEAPLPADQSVERHHQYEGEACDADEHDAKKHVLHVLITAALRDSSNKNPRSLGAISREVMRATGCGPCCWPKSWAPNVTISFQRGLQGVLGSPSSGRRPHASHRRSQALGRKLDTGIDPLCRAPLAGRGVNPLPGLGGLSHLRKASAVTRLALNLGRLFQGTLSLVSSSRSRRQPHLLSGAVLARQSISQTIISNPVPRTAVTWWC